MEILVFNTHPAAELWELACTDHPCPEGPGLCSVGRGVSPDGCALIGESGRLPFVKLVLLCTQSCSVNLDNFPGVFVSRSCRQVALSVEHLT